MTSARIVYNVHAFFYPSAHHGKLGVICMNTKNIPYKAIGLGLLVVLIIMAGSFLAFQSLFKSSPDELVVGEFVGGLTTMSIMRNQGLWEKYDVTVVVKQFTTPNALATALIKGEVDVTTGTPETYARLNEASNITFRIIGVEYTLLQQVLVRNDSGINSITDLQGKKIGVLTASGTYALFQSLMDKVHGIDDVESYFQVVNGFPGALIDSLINKEIDAAILWEPDISKAKTLDEDLKTLVTFEDLYKQATNSTESAPMVLWFASNKAISEKAELIQRFLEAQQEAVQIIKNDVEKAKTSLLNDQNLGLDQTSVGLLYEAVKDKFMEYTLTTNVKTAIRNAWNVFYNDGKSTYLTQDPSTLPDSVFWEAN